MKLTEIRGGLALTDAEGKPELGAKAEGSAESAWTSIAKSLGGKVRLNEPGGTLEQAKLSIELPGDMSIGTMGDDVLLSFNADPHIRHEIADIWKKHGVKKFNIGEFNSMNNRLTALRLGYYKSLAAEEGAKIKAAIIATVKLLKSKE